MQKCKEIWHELTSAIDANDESDRSFLVDDADVSEDSDAGGVPRRTRSDSAESDESLAETQRMIERYARIEAEEYTPVRKRKRHRLIGSQLSHMADSSDSESDLMNDTNSGKQRRLVAPDGTTTLSPQIVSKMMPSSSVTGTKRKRSLIMPRSRKIVDSSSSSSSEGEIIGAKARSKRNVVLSDSDD